MTIKFAQKNKIDSKIMSTPRLSAWWAPVSRWIPTAAADWCGRPTETTKRRLLAPEANLTVDTGIPYQLSRDIRTATSGQAGRAIKDLARGF
jgi:hypothetical protein